MRSAFYNHDIPYLTQQIYLNNELIATFSRPRSWRTFSDDGWLSAYPVAWVCPWCLQTWAHSTFQMPDGNFDSRPFDLHSVSCSTCNKQVGSTPPGSLIELGPNDFPLDPGIIDFAPQDLLEREFNILLSKAES